MERLSEKAKEIIGEHIDMIEENLADFIEGYYVYGSVSLGAFDYGVSDIDFIAVIKRKANQEDLDILKKIHADIQKKYNTTILDGKYILKSDIESMNKSENSCLRFNDGKFQGFAWFDSNSIDAYQLKKYGIAIKGKKTEDFQYTVDWDILIDNMRDNLNSYWINWVNGCKKFFSIRYIGLFANLKMIEWGVLGVSRLYYTFKEGDITSKIGAGEYALKIVPKRWHNIINESMRIRKGNKKSYYNSIFERRNDVVAYIDYIIQESNNLFKPLNTDKQF